MPVRLLAREWYLLLAGMTIAYSSVWFFGLNSSMPPIAPYKPDKEVHALPETKYTLSLNQSFDFMEEPDEQWHLREKIHADQLKLQNTHLKDCVDCNGHAFWQIHYEPSFSCAFQRRIGPIGDGGKWLCDPHRIAAEARSSGSCLVYSIGSNGEYGFEKAVHENVSEHCEIHTFDADPWQHYTEVAPPGYVAYHVAGIGPRPLSRLIRDLGHANRTIDIFKIDCESCELHTYEDWFASGVFIRQILVEVHGPGGWGGSAAQIHAFFRFLFRMGYVIFHKEPNTLANNFQEGGFFVEFALLRLRDDFGRVD